MARFRLRSGSCGLALATLGLMLTSVSSTPTNANPPARMFGVPVRRAMETGRVVRPMAAHGRHRLTAPSCSATPAPGSDAFDSTTTFTTNKVSTFGFSGLASANNAGVFEGNANSVCDFESAIAAGYQNVLDSGNGSNGGGAQDSFIGAGSDNRVSAENSFDGAGESNAVEGQTAFIGAGNSGLAFGNDSAVVAGYNNVSLKESSFVGGGLFGQAAGAAAFVGAGGEEYYLAQPGNPNYFGNIASGIDSFVGSGDLNQITSTGYGSFIGAGGYSYATSGADTPGNQISGTDSFIGAGDNNTVSAQEAFLGAGLGGNVSGEYSAIAGGYYDTVSGVGAFAGAGGSNVVSGQDAFVGSGNGNTASGEGSFAGAGGTAGGSTGNTASGKDSFVGAGDKNTAAAVESFVGSGGSNDITSSAAYSVLAGGYGNTLSGEYAAVGGGYGNKATGEYATVAGGDGNTATGNFSFAGGYHADAVNNGSFVWSDHMGSTTVKDNAQNQFVVRASGGVFFYSNPTLTSGVSLPSGSGAWANLSDRNAKTNIVPLDDASILSKVAALPVSSWSYKTESGVRHLGPMAQDFYAAFGVGEDDRHITSIDEDGVALAAIKALETKLERKDAQIEALDARVRRLEATIPASR